MKNLKFMLRYSIVETVEKCEKQLGQKMSFLRKLFSLSGCARLPQKHDNDKKEATEAVSDDGAAFEDNDFLIHKEDVRG